MISQSNPNNSNDSNDSNNPNNPNNSNDSNNPNNPNNPNQNSAFISRRNQIISITNAAFGVISLPVLMTLRNYCDSKESSSECNDDVNQKLATTLGVKAFSEGVRYFISNQKEILSYFNANNGSDQVRSDLESNNPQQFAGNQNIQVAELAQSQSASQNYETSDRRSMLISMTAASMGLVSFATLIGSRIYCASSADDSKECSSEVNQEFATALTSIGAILGARYFYNQAREGSNANRVSHSVPDQVRADLVLTQSPIQTIESPSSEPITGGTRNQSVQ